ncbi:MAG: leucine-rich repeat domain-containing protein [Clostridia bacterium]|nr:leucine-rich repeat domain-containing protein [Clostridia bacterium]
MKKTNKILSIILAITMVISIIPLTASAEAPTSGTCGDNATWTYDSSTYTLTISGTGDMYDYKSNNRPWEFYKDSIKNVVINDGVTAIGDYAFYYCTNINSVTISDSVLIIKKDSFCGCESLTSIIIPDSVTTVCDYAFAHCFSLTSITIPHSITTIGRKIFGNCYSLASITVDSNNQYYSSDKSGVLFNKDKTTLIQYPIANLRTSYTIPNSVSVVDDWAFTECQNLTSIIIPTDVTTIGLGAFYWCDKLTDVFYLGTEEQWRAISIGDENHSIFRATIHFNYHMHDYVEVVMASTCTEQGYTTYTCECGDSYVDDYVDALGHTPAEPVQQWPANATCTEDGSIYEFVYCSVCDEEISRELIVIEATGHADADNDGYCDNCDEQLCNHSCHKSGFAGFIWKILRFVNRIFGTNKYCSCGVAHY